jgi:hypothetical protein
MYRESFVQHPPGWGKDGSQDRRFTKNYGNLIKAIPFKYLYDPSCPKLHDNCRRVNA